ncbi:SusC/RagA family TonB-linked outer membrane protein [Paraflavitalea pollutisoli]|uniref:SusC/RagA family TonB-linked outer membrane protein n=1 Tax=Paraflavitalea pollutisoli TaxID=3034143 RepID=UPI0023EADD65|nr:SusC/RagA family TonB-linked outer membrane protein [Paraflavitalea sp. H1-2-19X]
MKRASILLITIINLLWSICGYAQDTGVQQQELVTLSFNNAPLTTIFKAIEKQVRRSVVYNEDWQLSKRKATIRVSAQPLKEVMTLLLQGHPYTFELMQQVIVIMPAAPTAVRPGGAGTGLLSEFSGRVVNQTGEPVVGANILAMGSKNELTTDANGGFRIGVYAQDSLRVSYVGYRTMVIQTLGKRSLQVTLETNVSELTQVVVSTGYQKQSIEKLTGSYSKLNQELLNYKVTTNILDRLDGVTSGMIFNPGVIPGNSLNKASISIRGRSTIFANPEPLIILDNFPYTGDINNINPNDIESVTVLKDAAAASIWGARAGNGVIVITSKMGKYKQAMKLSVNANVTVGAKPDLYYDPQMSSSDYVEVEKFLFGQGFYNDNETNPTHPALSPVVEILIQERDGLISSTKAQSLLDALKQNDLRHDKDKYFYRPSVNQQYSINASGGGEQNQYYFSAGYDRNLGSEVGSQYNRITVNANNTYAWWDKKVELSTGIIFTVADGKAPSPETPIRTPYAKLIDENGHPSTIYLNLRKSYLDTAGGGRLLDWTHRPLDEFNLSSNKSSGTDYRLNAGLKIKATKGLLINLLYQYNRGFTDLNRFYSQETFYTRNLINLYTQLNGNTTQTPIPYGGILDRFNSSTQAHIIRSQIDYTKTWNSKHSLTAFGGSEIQSLTRDQKYDRVYGYIQDRQTGTVVDYNSTFPMYNNPSYEQKIDNPNKSWRMIDRFISYFINTAYTFKQRYTFTASARKDESNIFGVKTNQKGVPLWSTGFSWELSKETFYKQQNWLPYLRFRLTYGYNGNVDRSVSAHTTALITSTNTYGAPSGNIANPPNPNLRWEKVRMTNLGIDFASLKNVITGSLEFYLRKADDLIGNSPLDPTTGLSNFRGNTANMKGKGVDITLNTLNIATTQFKWSTNWLFSYTSDQITKYLVQQNNIGSYLNTDYINPLEERPVYAIYSLPWRGLDPQNGDPIGELDGVPSKDYVNILKSADFSTLRYNGPANPTLYGALRNNIEWKGLSISFNITWKAGYYFRRSSVDYDELLGMNTKGHSDFAKRWQSPGDELHTNVPSLDYPINTTRNQFYRLSNILVEKGDHFRLQDARIQYNPGYKALRKLPLQSIQFYIYANNIGLLWKANNQGIDPDYVAGWPPPFTVAGGIKLDFK